MPTPISVSSDEQLESLLNTHKDKLVVIDFHATWCGPCKAIAPQFNNLAESQGDKVFLKVDIDQCQESANTYNVSAVPTFAVIHNNKMLENIRGGDMNALQNAIQTHGSMISSLGDLRKMSVKELKEAIKERKVSLVGCVEKEDLVRRLLESLRSSELQGVLRALESPKADLSDRDALLEAAKEALGL